MPTKKQKSDVFVGQITHISNTAKCKNVKCRYNYHYMEFKEGSMINSRKKLRKKQKNFIYPLAFLSGLRYNKDTKVVKSGAKNQQSGEKWWKI